MHVFNEERRMCWLAQRFPVLAAPVASNAFHFILVPKYRPRLVVRRWGKSWRLTRDPELAHVFDEKIGPTAQSAAMRARGQRETVESCLNVPLSVVWVRSKQEQRLARLNKEHGVTA
jgi:hypothetical protein